MNNRFDWTLLAPSLALVVLSLATLFSINPTYFVSQLIYVIISVGVFFLFSHSHHTLLKLYAAPIYIASLIVLLFVLIVGFESRGAVRWIDIYGFRIQFSEIFKPFLLVSLSWFLSQGKATSFGLFAKALLFLLPIALLIFLQPDLGSALIYVFTVVATLLVFGFPFRWFLGGIASFLLAMPVVWRFLHDYQKQRILAFVSPQSDPLGSSYNAMQALIAVGSGMFFGKGLGQGTQSALRFLPERQTDFIFATFSESFGFVGGFVMLCCFGFLLYRIYILSKQVDDTFRRVYCVSAFFLLLIQFFVNIGMNIGLVPIVGVTLPFVSYGGSSMLSSFILLGILSSFRFELTSREILEIR